MKQLIASCLLYSLTTLLAAQPTIEWQKVYGGSGDDYASSMQSTSDGGYVMVGHCWSNDEDISGNNGTWDCWVVKVGNTGAIQWSRALGGSFFETSPNIQQTTDGGYVMVCNSQSNDGDVSGNHGGTDIWVVKLSPDGSIEWQRSIGGSSGDGVRSYSGDETQVFFQANDGGYIVAGTTSSTNFDALGNHGQRDILIVKLTGDGFTQWIKVLGGSNTEAMIDICQTSDNGYIIGGHTNSNDGDVTGFHAGIDFWVIKLSSEGVVEWEKAMGGSGDDLLKSILQTSDGGYLAVGGSSSTEGDVIGNHGKSDFWATKLTNAGTLEWQKSFGGSEHDEASSIHEADEGGYIIGGITRSTDGDVTGNHGGTIPSDYWLVKINNAGAILWEKALGGTMYDDNIFSLKTLNDGGYILAGRSISNDGDITIEQRWRNFVEKNDGWQWR